MALDPIAMTNVMLARAFSKGLFNAPPEFGLSRTYFTIAKGIVQAILDPTATIITVAYGPGQPLVTPPVFPILPGGLAGPVVGLTGLDAETFWPLIQVACGYFGPYSEPFFYGLGGIIDYLQPTVQMTDLYAPTGTGVGTLAPGGILFDADKCFDNMHDEAVAQQLMVVRLLVHLSDPLGTYSDPITQLPLGLNDLFSRAEILLKASAIQMASELLKASKIGIPVVGAFLPLPVPPIVGATITSVLF